MSSHSKSPKKIVKTPKYHRSVFGNTSPSNSIFAGSNGILSPNFNVVNSKSGWNSSNLFKKDGSKLSINKSKDRTSISITAKHSSLALASKSASLASTSSKNRTLGDLFNERSENKKDDEPRKLRRTNTSELMDRFIPNRQTTSGKLSIEKTKSLPSFAMPLDHIENQKNEFYQNSVAEACGLEVGQRILKFQPLPPDSKHNSTQNSTTETTDSKHLRRVSSFNSNFRSRSYISTNAAQARIKKIPLCPEKVLDAPGLVDDFYLHLIAWSNDNLLAIALDKSVYIWNANDGSVNLITECETIITSIKWSPDDYYLSIGLNSGIIEIWDIEKKSKIRTMKFNNFLRIAAQSWNNFNLTIGMKNGEILNNDVRISNHLIDKFLNHSSEVCGLSWRSDGLQLASGGNDNLVNIWDYRKSCSPIFTKTAHNAAVKALAWCPNQLSLLATGGGSACKKIHFWNSNTGIRINSIDCESQISSLKWGYSNGIGQEIVSTHGFPNNEICVYSYPSLQKTGVIMEAHENRILNSELSPNGTILATISSDENLKFWKLFDTPPEVSTDAMLTTADSKNLGKVMTIR